VLSSLPEGPQHSPQGQTINFKAEFFNEKGVKIRELNESGKRMQAYFDFTDDLAELELESKQRHAA